jgi:lysophospholipase L1-like esterase
MKNWLANLAVVLVAAAVPCVVAEVGLRIAAPEPTTKGLFRKLPSSPVEFSGQPNARGMDAGVPVAFNSLGLRDAERSPQPAPGTIRILALGDSVTFGLGVAQEQTYPRQTELLLGKASGAPVEVLNMGMPGYNTLHQLAQLREVGFALQPRVVVVGYLYNDIEQSMKQQGQRSENQQAAGAGALRSRVNAAALWLKKNSLFIAWLSPRLGLLLRPLGFKGFGQVGVVKDQYVDSNPHWRRVRDTLLEMKRLSDERGIELVVMILPAMVKFSAASYPIAEYHQAVAGFCRESGIKCLDTLPAFWGLDGSQMWISATDGHPDARAHRIIAEALAAFLAPLLPSHGMLATGTPRR